VQQQTCENNGGTWNPGNCSCSYPPPDPCRGSNPTPKDSDPSIKEGDLQPIMPCRPALPF
jgi:hypothetical protein